MKFEDLIGNNDTKQKLKKAIDTNTISNTLLFAGPEGVGKSNFARVLACSLMHPEFDIDPIALKKIEECSCPGGGSCAGLFTANSMSCLTEVLGLSLTRCGTMHAVDPEKLKLAFKTGQQIVQLVKKDLRPRDFITS